MQLEEVVKTQTMQSEDERRGSLSAAERRRLQNRLNQRAHRQRKAAQTRANPNLRGSSYSRRKWIVTAPNDYLEKSRGRPSLSNSKNRASSQANKKQELSKKNMNEPHSSAAYTLLKKLHENIYLGLAQGSPIADLILSVTQFNVIRAVISNIATMGLTVEDMRNEDILSPWNMKSPWKVDPATLPPTLRPTELQKMIPHHPWMDPLPIPSIRDVLLRRMGEYDDTEICNDMMGECGSSSGRPGLIIWSDPCDAHGFEITESFAQKWLWMFRGCTDLLISTNYWRSRRGELPLFCDIF